MVLIHHSCEMCLLMFDWNKATLNHVIWISDHPQSNIIIYSSFNFKSYSNTCKLGDRGNVKHFLNMMLPLMGNLSVRNKL